MGILQTLGKFVQDSLQTNTAKELASDVSDIYYDYKRPRAIWCLSWSVILGAGAVALVVVDSTTYGYIGPIVEDALPFLGTIGTKIAVGTIGFWFGGALGHNGAKFTSQVFHERRAGVSNSAYAFNDADVERIIDANPQHYPQADDLEAAPVPKAQQVAELKNQLHWLVKKVYDHKGDSTDAKARYKVPLLSALRFSNIQPLIELLAVNDAKRNVRVKLAQVTAEYLSEGGARFVASGTARPIAPTRELIEDSEEEDDNKPVQLRLDTEPLPPPPPTPRANAVLFKHMERQAKDKFYPLREGTGNKGTKTVADGKKVQVVTNLRQGRQAEDLKRQAENELAGRFRRFF